jgi:hypothetical protein
MAIGNYSRSISMEYEPIKHTEKYGTRNQGKRTKSAKTSNIAFLRYNKAYFAILF